MVGTTAAFTTDGRTRAEHDCDRILYSDELRRLGGVTQVVATGETPLFHTRLTHTLKVQQLARRIAEHLSRDPSQSAGFQRLPMGLDVAAAEAAGLAHDLGHPPFGHIGEAILDSFCRGRSLDGFEGNAQSFRILTKLFPAKEGGQPISDVTLRAIIKYPWLREIEGTKDSQWRKWNAYPTEKGIFDSVRLAKGKSVEAEIMDWADDITYAVHDLEDFVRADYIPLRSLCSDPGEWVRFWGAASKSVMGHLGDTSAGDVQTELYALFRLFFLAPAGQRGAKFNAQLRVACGNLIHKFVSAAVLREEGVPGVEVPALERAFVELLQQLTWHYVIWDPRLASIQRGQKETLRQLVLAVAEWTEDAVDNDRLFELPMRLQVLLAVAAEEEYANEDSRRGRAVADFVASLTEDQAINLASRLLGGGRPSVLDGWVNY